MRAVIGLTGHTSQEIRAVNEQRLHSGRQQPDATFMELVARKIKEEDDLIREAVCGDGRR